MHKLLIIVIVKLKKLILIKTCIEFFYNFINEIYVNIENVFQKILIYYINNVIIYLYN